MIETPRQTPALYVHVPFCLHKCGYCAFYSLPPEGEAETDRYVEALCREMSWLGDAPAPETIFFGGGTPTLLNLHHWERILRQMESLKLLGAIEWTVECNPATLSDDKARFLRDHGVSRLSLGIQSLDDRMLHRLGRVHTRDMALDSFDLLRRAGFDNINIDLMFAIPGQSLEHWQETLTEALALGSEHLSSYEVTYEEDTPLYQQLNAGQFDVDDDLVCAMYDELVSRAAQAGLERYEISNFARNGDASAIDIPSRACLHNVNYWRGGAYWGLGPSATQYIRGVRSQNWANTKRYCDMVEQGTPPVASTEELPPLHRAGELAAFGLRMSAGWPFHLFKKVTGFELRNEWRSEMNRLIQMEYAREDSERFQLTSKGLRFADWAAELFLR